MGLGTPGPAKGVRRHRGVGKWDLTAVCTPRAEHGRALGAQETIRVLQGLKFIWAAAQLSGCPEMQRPWGQCQHWDRVLLPGPAVSVHLAWLWEEKWLLVGKSGPGAGLGWSGMMPGKVLEQMRWRVLASQSLA